MSISSISQTDFKRLYPIVEGEEESAYLTNINDICDRIKNATQISCKNDCHQGCSSSSEHQRLSFLTGHENRHISLYDKIGDYERSKLLCQLIYECKDNVEKALKERFNGNTGSWNILMNNVIEYSQYIASEGKTIGKIIECNTEINNLIDGPKGQGNLVQAFLRRLDQVLYQNDRIVKQPNHQGGLLIVTCSAGGAHESIANVVRTRLLKEGITCEEFNETKEYHNKKDPLYACIGISHSELYNKIFQQKGWQQYNRKLKDLWVQIKYFIASPRSEIAEEKTQGKQYVYSCSHHPYNIRLLSKGIRKICFQICDFGRIPDKLEIIARNVIKSQIDNIYFFAPSDSTTIEIDKKKRKVLDFNNYVFTTGYPVHNACLDDINQKQVKEKFRLRNGAALVVMSMGGQGVGGILEGYATQIIGDNELKFRKIDILVACGNNIDLKKNIETIANDYLEDKNNLKIFPSGFIAPQDFIPLLRCCDAYITKPGGATVAEAIYGKLPLLIHQNDKTPQWERRNTKEAIKRHVGQKIENPESIGKDILTRLNSSYTPSSDDTLPNCYIYTLIKIFQLQKTI